MKRLNNGPEDSLNYIIDELNYDREFYEADFQYEYSPFEESVK